MQREELLIELKARELEEKQISLDRKQLEDSIRKQIYAKMALEEQIRDLEMRRLQRKQEEEQFRIEQLKLFAEEDRLELLTREKQRIKKQEHHQRLRELLAKRKAAREAEIIDLIQERNEIIAMEKRR